MEILSLWFFGKLFAMLALLIYAVFAAVVVRQIYLMTRTVSVGVESPLKFVAWAHLSVAIVVFLFTLVFL